MLAIVHTVALSGLDGQVVRVEVDMGTGLPGWEDVGRRIHVRPGM